MLKKLLFNRCCNFFLNEFMLPGMSWLSQTPEKNNRALGHLCAHIGLTGPGEPPEDGEMIKMTLSSKHRIRNSSPAV